jgi:adenosine kinase
LTAIFHKGGDEVGKDMEKLLHEEGIRTEYLVDPSATTGLCAVLVSAGANRSLVTRLDAANLYKHSHLLSERVWQAVEESSFFYMSVSDGTLR